jgi:hypothetical protein
LSLLKNEEAPAGLDAEIAEFVQERAKLQTELDAVSKQLAEARRQIANAQPSPASRALPALIRQAPQRVFL